MAVYTEVTDDDVAAFLQEYDLGEVVSMKGIAEGVENSNFLLSTTTGTYILTLYEKRVKRDDLPFFLGLMDHLAARGIRCPTPIHGRDGEALRELCGRPAAIVTFLQGMWPKRIDVHHCRKLGRAIAQMHAAGRDFPLTRTNDLSVQGWRPLLDACGARADEIESGLSNELQTELEGLEQAWPAQLPEGVIHADLFPDNVFFHQGELSGFIDFYFACNDQLAYDLAVCLNAWCFETNSEFNATKARALLQAYQEVRPFSEAELQALPILAQGAAMRFLLTRLFDWLNHPEGAYVAPKDPREYLRKLRFHRAVRGPGAYGLT
ncbi:homoserine kinase [Rhodovibrio salinarum]|uniref:Homoserine kinase n=1 Tax=Rhodovibrio salinarum TaxID=1087 RepID=A0A934QHZ6_9PROT|nr:homoserine kinase [Rhodovibrio salinarum]MBK1697052.1 homoserine kinase [Rhodovibrio salinarum]